MANASRPERLDRRHPYRLPSEMYRHPLQPVSLTVRSRWRGNLAQAGIAEAIISGMGRMGTRFGVHVSAYCIMPDHLHAVVLVAEDGGDLGKWVRYFKREAARAAHLKGVWQRSFWDRHVREREDEAELVRYVLANPVRRGLCDRWYEWPYSWADSEDDSRGPHPGL